MLTSVTAAGRFHALQVIFLFFLFFFFEGGWAFGVGSDSALMSGATIVAHRLAADIE